MEELTQAGKEARRRYNREYYRRRKEQQRQADIRYWNRQGEKLAKSDVLKGATAHGDTKQETG